MPRLTRAAIAAFFRWREAEPNDRPRVAALLGLHEGEVAALARLEMNLKQAGPPDTWIWQRSNRTDLREGLVDTILDDLCVEPEQVEALARLCKPSGMGLGHMLGVAFRKQLEGQTDDNGARPQGTASSRLREALAARGLNVESELGTELRRELAQEVGINTSQVSTYLSQWRKKAVLGARCSDRTVLGARCSVLGGTGSDGWMGAGALSSPSRAPGTEGRAPCPPSTEHRAPSCPSTIPPGTLKQRVWAAFEAGGWNLAAPIPKARCQEVAAQFGTTLGAIRNYLADLRREKEIPLGRPGRCKPEANERRCAWGNRRRDQIREALVHRGLLLTTLLSDATKEEIARETGMSLHSCRQYVSQLRKEAGISRPRSLSPNRFPTPKQERTMDTEENGTDALQLASTGTNGPIPQVFQPHGSFAAQAEPPSALGEALSDLVRVALEHGWRSIEPEAFREPIRKLLETITGPKEEASR